VSHSVNGAVNYTYDAVGNRTQMTSTLTPIPAGLFNYNSNDQFTAGDTYDANGNTTSSGGITNVYDFENHLIQKGGVSIVYDGDGNRVAKTVAGVTTTYLVDTLNPTGYAQVIGESFSTASSPNGEASHNYVYGLELISQTRKFNVSGNGNTQQIFYAYDGHGSVRALTNTSGAVTDTYDYDAFGNLIHSTGSTPNNYLFAGEQFDPDLALYYNRARYLNVSTGRFWTMDPFEGYGFDPDAFHKYLYAEDDPANHLDRSGNQVDDLVADAVEETLETMPTLQPEVEETAVAVAESVAAEAETQNSLSNIILFALAAGTAASQKGDNQPNSRPAPRSDDSSNRGSLQVQGRDILEGRNSLNLAGHSDFKANEDTVSWQWNLPAPLDAFTASSKLGEFLQILTPAQSGRRERAFSQAARFITNAALGGGVRHTFKKSFNARDSQYPDARVDINVDAGLAFVPIF